MGPMSLLLDNEEVFPLCNKMLYKVDNELLMDNRLEVFLLINHNFVRLALWMKHGLVCFLGSGSPMYYVIVNLREGGAELWPETSTARGGVTPHFLFHYRDILLKKT